MLVRRTNMVNKKMVKRVFLSTVLCTLTLIGLGEGVDAVPIDGGVTDRTDHQAPKAIVSKDITDLYARFFLFDEGSDNGEGDVYTFEIKETGTVLMAFESRSGLSFPADKKLLRKLQDIIDKHSLAAYNGVYEITAGLPVEFQPCDFTAGYASGEVLHFTMDNDPEAEWAREVYQTFAEWFAKKGDASLLTKK